MIIGICGRKQHGKTTVANILVEQHGFVAHSFADPLRKMMEALDPYVEPDAEEPQRYSEMVGQVGYERAKQFPEVRRLLQRLGTEAGRNVLGEDVWVRAMEHTLNEESAKDIVIPDVRFPNEKLFIEAAGGKMVRVLRSLDQEADVHESERYADEMDVDVVIINNSTPDALKLMVAHTLLMLKEM